MKPNYVIGFLPPWFAVWTVSMAQMGTRHAEAIVAATYGGSKARALRSIAVLVSIGILRWLSWCLPMYGRDRNGESYRFLWFYLSVIRGPYACTGCGRATTQGPDLENGVPSHCNRKPCIDAANPWELP